MKQKLFGLCRGKSPSPLLFYLEHTNDPAHHDPLCTQKSRSAFVTISTIMYGGMVEPTLIMNPLFLSEEGIMLGERTRLKWVDFDGGEARSVRN